MEEEQIEQGPTTWKCLCGKTEVTEAFVLPKGWVKMNLSIGDGTILYKQSEKLLCEACGSRFLMGGVRAMNALPATSSAARLPAQNGQKTSTTARVRSSGESRFRK